MSRAGRENDDVGPDSEAREKMRPALPIVVLVVILLTLDCTVFAAPIQRIEGVITEVGEGFLWLKPDGDSAPQKFILRWKARFVPLKLPLKGDRVLILYKNRDGRAVIYGVNYLPPPSGSPSSASGPESEE